MKEGRKNKMTEMFWKYKRMRKENSSGNQEKKEE